MSAKVAVIGECMLELRNALASRIHVNFSEKPMILGYGGDTLNTSVYLSRQGIQTSYVSALGDDANSEWMLDEWTKEGINCSLVSQVKNALPGMYLIETDHRGERSFYYWRDGSPASKLFDDEKTVQEIFKKLGGFDYLYLSGISLGILPFNSLERLVFHLKLYSASGGKIIFDGNYRPRLWKSKEIAQETFREMYQIAQVALPTLEDEIELFGLSGVESVLHQITDLGVEEVVIKMGAQGCLSYSDKTATLVEANPVEVIDTTAAGDSFNAAYLAARIKNIDAVEACKAAHRLASTVIQHRGAIIPRGVH